MNIMKIDSTFSIPCPKCGGTEFAYSEPLDDGSIVKCDSCGFEAALEDIREHGLHEAESHLTKQVKREFEKTIKKLFK